jgi:hypothetical protein
VRNSIWPLGMNPRAREICDYLFGSSVGGSHVRSREFVFKALGLPTHVFWPVFLDTWCSCDRIWPDQRWILEMLRRHSARQSARPYMTKASAEFFDALAPSTAVCPGCSRYRVRGLAWTTEHAIAAKFVSGIRFNMESDRALAEAIIIKDAIFAVCVERGESEIILDPRRLRKLQLHSCGGLLGGK